MEHMVNINNKINIELTLLSGGNAEKMVPWVMAPVAMPKDLSSNPRWKERPNSHMLSSDHHIQGDIYNT